MLEAAKSLIAKGGLPMLTTNAVAATAGVSIGSFYQYFASKEALLDELASRETAAMATRVLAVIDSTATTPEQRVVGTVRAVLASYDHRRDVHRVMLEHSLARGSKRLATLTDALIIRLTSDARRGSNRPMLTPSQAFVVTQAFVGVLRAIVSGQNDDMPSGDVEAALATLVSNLANA